MQNLRFLYCLLLFGLLACQEESQVQQPKQELVLVAAPNFHADSAYQFVAKQVAFGPRTPNSKAHQQCGDYLLETLSSFGMSVSVQNFTATAYDGLQMNGRNIIGSFNPQATRRILLAAHWDTRRLADKEKDESKRQQAIDGANDGGSGVAVILEIMRTIHLAAEKPNIGIDVIFFDLEDDGVPEYQKFSGGNDADYWCHGSRYWSKNPHKAGYTAYYGILLDMVGARNAQFKKEGYSMQFAALVVEKVWAIAQKLNYGSYFLNQKSSGGVLDDHYFVNVNAKIPMIDIIEYDQNFGAYHHTLDDNLSIIDPNSLKAVGQTVLQCLYQEASLLK